MTTTTVTTDAGSAGQQLNQPPVVPPGAKPADGTGSPTTGDDPGLQQRFDGLQQVNRDLEAKLNQLRDGLKSALGVEDKKADANQLVDQISALRGQVTDLAHTNLVNEVARANNITDDADLALIAKQPDKASMEALAVRLKPAEGAPTPKPDLSQGLQPAGKPDAKPGLDRLRSGVTEQLTTKK